MLLVSRVSTGLKLTAVLGLGEKLQAVARKLQTT
jgi:hypothetical protein